MLKPLKTYTPDSPNVSAQDLNTMGDVVRMMNNITGPNVFVDASGIHFREKRPTVVPDSTGQYDGMIPQMTSQLTKGWGYLRLVNRPT